MTVARLRQEMSARELNGWIELEQIRRTEREQAESKMRRGR